MNFIDFYNQAQVDPIGGLINEYRDRVLDDGGSFFNACLRNRLNAELPFEDRLNILPANAVGVGKLYAFKGNDYTFTRAGNAYRFNTAGNLVLVGNDVPRINITQSVCPQLVVEPQITNLWTNNQIASGFSFASSLSTSLGAIISDYFGTGISGITLNFDGTGGDTADASRLRIFSTNIHNYCTMLISNPITNFFSLNFGVFRTVFNLTTLENTTFGTTDRQFGFIRKVKDNVWLVGVHYIELSANLRRVACGFLSIPFVLPILAQSGSCIIGVPSVWTSATPLFTTNSLTPMPYPVTGSTLTKIADVATLTPPISTTEIIVNNNAPITTIPSSFQIPNGLIDKVVMR
jgi:hypothetical protein